MRKLSVLSQETERADDRRFLCLSLADGEKADDADNEQDGIADAAGYRNKKGPEEHRADDPGHLRQEAAGTGGAEDRARSAGTEGGAEISALAVLQQHENDQGNGGKHLYDQANAH